MTFRHPSDGARWDAITLCGSEYGCFRDRGSGMSTSNSCRWPSRSMDTMIFVPIGNIAGFGGVSGLSPIASRISVGRRTA